MTKKITITYVTANPFKREEAEEMLRYVRLADGTLVGDLFDFSFRKVSIKEVLEVDLNEMVRAEAVRAYATIKIPCLVEHAGLIFEGHRNYPGGLTKAMWDALKDRFVEETGSVNKRCAARAVIGYCDGRSIYTFAGVTMGHIAEQPIGSREFYWDTIFIPDLEDGSEGQLTYAEIVQRGGLVAKIQTLSQSTRAMKEFLEYRRLHNPDLWP